MSDPYYARSIINGKEVANEQSTTLCHDITIYIPDGKNIKKNQLSIKDLVSMCISKEVILYQLKAAGIELPKRRATITNYKKIDTTNIWQIRLNLIEKEVDF